ncbi:MAG: hypothetical protein R6W77_11290 [Trueperaceae bacterium]
MTAPAPRLRAGTLAQAEPSEIAAEAEMSAMARLLDAGMACGWLVIPAVFEERYYRLNNLPARLRSLYAGLDPADPDEDIVEEAAEAATRLFREHFLLDEAIDAFYAGLETMASRLALRRPGASSQRMAHGDRPALLAWKRVYQHDWTVDAVMERLEHRASLAIDARPVLVHDADERTDPRANARAVEVLGNAVRLKLDVRGAVTRISFG